MGHAIFIIIIFIFSSCNYNHEIKNDYKFNPFFVREDSDYYKNKCFNLHFERYQYQSVCYDSEIQKIVDRTKVVKINKKITQYCKEGVDECCLSDFIYLNRDSFLKNSCDRNSYLCDLYKDKLSFNTIFSQIKKGNILILDYIIHIGGTIRDGSFQSLENKLINSKAFSQYSMPLVRKYCKKDKFICSYLYSHLYVYQTFLPKKDVTKFIKFMEQACYYYKSQHGFCHNSIKFLKNSGALNPDNLNKNTEILYRYFNLLYRICIDKGVDCSDLQYFCENSEVNIKSKSFLKYIKPKCTLDIRLKSCKYQSDTVFEGTVYEDWWKK